MNNSDTSDALSREIARILQQQAATSRARNHRPSAGMRATACGSIALLALGPATGFAVGLGELRLNSALGQPLRATVPLRLAAGEAVAANCVRNASGPEGGLRAPRGLKLRVPAATGPGDFDIELYSERPLYEPMYELSLQVQCPGLPILVRQFVLMLDLPAMPGPSAARPVPPPRAVVRQPRPQTAPRSRPERRLARSDAPIPAGSVYRVREGDTLSTIAARVEGRPANFTWPLARLIFEANPDAFIRGNPDLVKLGARLRIPAPAAWADAPDGNEARVVAERPAAAPLLPPLEPAPSPAATLSPAPAALPLPPALPSDATAAEDPPAVATPAAAAVADSPFADEQGPAEAPAPATPAAVASSPPGDTGESGDAPESPVPAAPATAASPPPLVISPERGARLNPLVATLFGMLIGLGISVLLLRGRLLEGALALLGRRRPQADTASPAADETFDDTDDWMPVRAAAAPEVPVREVDQTYVVEIEPAEETSATFDPALAGDDAPPAADAPERPPAEAAFEPAADEVELTELFDEELAESPETGSPAGDAAAGTSGDETVEELGPTAELPHFNDSDAAMTAAIGDSEETAELAELGDESLDTGGLTLEQLAQAELSAEDTRLSQTLRDALTLLERDYEDELTASQIIDRDALKNALDQKEGSG
ncbi:MAG: hypothetical protein D6727_00675 [Gammaproteobacteria bacterium]|nr:MAG: hypothetical protein D6727_00675 [Gammaproteobacteria bacterium]